MRRTFQYVVFSLLLTSVGCQYNRLQAAKDPALLPVPTTAKMIPSPGPINQVSSPNGPLAPIPAIPAAEEFETLSNVALPSPSL